MQIVVSAEEVPALVREAMEARLERAGMRVYCVHFNVTHLNGKPTKNYLANVTLQVGRVQS